MITPEEAYKLSMPVALLQELEAEIDAAIKVAAPASQWPCLLVTHAQESAVQQVAAKYREAGWRIEVERHREPGGSGYLALLKLAAPTPTRTTDGGTTT